MSAVERISKGVLATSGARRRRSTASREDRWAWGGQPSVLVKTTTTGIPKDRQRLRWWWVMWVGLWRALTRTRA